MTPDKIKALAEEISNTNGYDWDEEIVRLAIDYLAILKGREKSKAPMNYYAAVGKNGAKNLYRTKPFRAGEFWCLIDEGGEWEDIDIPNFPDITWDDEPKLVNLTIEVVSENK